MNWIYYQHPTTSERLRVKVKQVSWTARVRGSPWGRTMAAADEHMSGKGFVRRCKWRPRLCVQDKPRATKPTVWQNFKALFRRRRAEKVAV